MDTMAAIKQTFFQECEEQLAELENGLLAIERQEGDLETINAVFRAVHSIKGGAGAFGLDDLVRFAHTFETTLDLMRSNELEITTGLIKLMLRAADGLADLVRFSRDGADLDRARIAQLNGELARAAKGEPAAAAEPMPAAPAIADEPAADENGFVPIRFSLDDLLGEPAPSADETPADAPLTVRFKPKPELYAKANDAVVLLREIRRLGEAKIACDTSEIPLLTELDPEGAYLSWAVELDPAVQEASVREIFEFVVFDCDLDIGIAPEPVSATILTLPEPPSTVAEAAFAPAPVQQTETATVIPLTPERDLTPTESLIKAGQTQQAAAGGQQTTIRVDLDRVDRLIDLVGELVINQSMLAQRVMEAGIARLSEVAVGLDDLEHLTREIQDSVMAIRAQPVRSVFQRMPRLVREIAAATGKQVRLVTEGEGTEVDKTVIERLSDPITHMLRNAVDHGLETPDERIAAGKPAEGTVKMAALHRSGRIVIEVADDGKGINRPRVRDIAVSKGLIAPDAVLSDDEIDNLIFLPGFSTAAAVSNISGRGVGMDVVKRSIQALGGRISISSVPGKGSTFSMSLPLTLAVLDGMVVSVGNHTLVAPLTAIIETLRPKPADMRRLGPTGSVLVVRGAHVPLIDIGMALGWRNTPIDPAGAVTLLVENEGGGRAALVVDDIQGQRQVVIKSLASNYQSVDGVAAATILGDGRVALILDVDAIIERRTAMRPEPTLLAKAS